jgi:hypothetical protein
VEDGRCYMGRRSKGLSRYLSCPCDATALAHRAPTGRQPLGGNEQLRLWGSRTHLHSPFRFVAGSATMAPVGAELMFALYDGGAGTARGEWPPDHWLLLTPEKDIRARIDCEALAAFWEQLEVTLRDYCAATTRPLDELQVACALLPSQKRIVEVQAFPAETRTFHARHITTRLRSLDVPAVMDGSIVFARRICLRAATEARPFKAPFLVFATGAAPTPLDEVACAAAGVVRKPPTIWDRAATLLKRTGERQQPRGTKAIGALLFERTNVAVAAIRKSPALQGIPEPFKVVQSGTTDLTAVRYANGTPGVVDAPTLQYATSRAPQPTQAALDMLFDEVVRARVLEGGMVGGKALGEEVLLELVDPTEVGELRAKLMILDGPAGHCMCHGGPSLELLAAGGKSLAVLGLHHGRSIRWAAWKDDAELLDGNSLLEWLASRGVEGPLAEHRETERQQELQRAALQRWNAALPAGLNTISRADWQRMARAEDLSAALEALWKAYPQRSDAVLAMFAWFGSGLGPWSGFPVYEQVAERLLGRVAVDALVGALENDQVSATQLEGAARFFAGNLFAAAGPKPMSLTSIFSSAGLHVSVPKHSGGPAAIPVALRQRLLAHCLASDDTDKRSRAQSAFADG